MSGASNDDSRCPICEQHNECGIAQGKSHCWCFEEPVDATVVELLAELRIEDRCLCRQCAAGDVPSPCVRACTLDRDAQTCMGCRRTLPEIASWSSLDPVERARIRVRASRSRRCS